MLPSHLPAAPPVVTPWSLRAWPPLLWQASDTGRMRFRHVDTRVTSTGDDGDPPTGQTVWAGHSDTGDAGMAWDWVQIASGVVAIADPLAVVTNLRLVGERGEVLTAHEAALFLNEYVRALPWQHEVVRALHACAHTPS